MWGIDGTLFNDGGFVHRISLVHLGGNYIGGGGIAKLNDAGG